MAGSSMSIEVQHRYQLRSRIPRPPSTFMLLAQEKRRSVAAENPNENNQRVSSHLGKLWRSLSAVVKEPYQRKAAEAAVVHRRNYPDYVYNPREAHQHKGQERRAKAVVSKPKNGCSGDQEQQPSISTAVAQDRGFHEFHHPPRPTQMNERRGTSAARGGASGALVSSTLLNDEDDDSSAGTSSFDQSGYLESLGSAGGAPGEGQPSQSAAGSLPAYSYDHQYAPAKRSAPVATGGHALVALKIAEMFSKRSL
ncbi:sex-determining region Y protein [Dermacentor silvarum]|uniref:sex-determining region Y protein n=1 Tax=Dermacentor silvarum TaxID=543639 RepID=UPI0021016129|nr:sex-determining region Y protein [Dermacentor silvarum]